MLKLFQLIFLLIITQITACSDDSTTPESEIKTYIKSGVLAAENRNHHALGDLISEHYHEKKHTNKKQLLKVAHTYFFLHKNIHLFTKINNITFKNKNQASVLLYIAMTGTVITDLNQLSRVRAQIYKFELLLIKDDAWLLHQAHWEKVKLKEMLLENIK